MGNFTTAFDSNYKYTVSGDEQASISKGSSWTDTQLKLSVGAGLLKNITDTVTTIKEPNAKGKNITLLAGTNLGSFDAELNVNWKELKALAAKDVLTKSEQDRLDSEKAALAAAERGDATVVGDVIKVLRPRPVNVTTGTGALNATATSGFALIGSEQDLRLNTVTVTGDIRIKTSGSVINAATAVNTANVVGGNIILEAGAGAVGASGAPIRVAPVGDSGVTARAANGIWIDAMQDFYVDTMYSPSNIFLTSVGSIFDFPNNDKDRVTPANNMLADFITLTALGGSIGTLENPLEVGVTGRGFVTATARTLGQGVYLNGAAGENFSIGPVLSGDVISLTSVDNVLLAGGTITAPGAIIVVAGTDGTGSVGIAAAPADVIVVDTPSTLNVSAASNINVAGQITSVGKATLTAGDNLVFSGGSITGQQDLSLTAGSDGSGSIVGSVTADTDVVAFGNLLMQAPDAVGAVAKVTNTATLLSSSINADISTTPLSNPLSLSVSDIGGGPASNVVMNVASSNQVNFNTFNVDVAQINANTPSLQVPNGNITNYAVFNMPAYSTRIDTLSRVAHPGYNVNGFTLGGAFNLSALINSVSLGTFILIKDPYLQVAGNFAGNVEDVVQSVLQLQQFGVGANPLQFNIGNFGLDVPSIVKDGSLVDVNVDWLDISLLAPNAEDEKEKEIQN